MSFRISAAWAGVFFFALFLSVASARTWTDTTGKFSIDGELVSFNDGVVEIRKADGKSVRLPLEKLSKADQDFVRQNVKAPAVESPFADQPHADDGQVMTVIGEGVGTSADEALKDAFRNSVRQVVGAVVDAETLVENDEVIEDKILTYSDGFIKKYDEVSGSKRQQGVLHRIKISAQVERRSVIVKLKAANISTKAVDGKSLFAEEVSKAEGEANATVLLTKALADLPTLLIATVEGKPSFDRNTSEVVLNVSVQADRKAYQAFAERLELTLKKVAIAQDSTLVKATPFKGRGKDGREYDMPGAYEVKNHPALTGPRIDKSRSGAWCIWVTTPKPSNDAACRWNAYVVEADVGVVLGNLEVPYVTALSE